MFRGFRRRTQVFARRAVTQVHLARCNFVTMDQAAIEAHVVGATYACAEHSELAVDRDAAGTNPVLGLAARRHTETREHLLQTLALRNWSEMRRPVRRSRRSSRSR